MCQAPPSISRLVEWKKSGYVILQDIRIGKRGLIVLWLQSNQLYNVSSIFSVSRWELCFTSSTERGSGSSNVQNCCLLFLQ